FLSGLGTTLWAQTLPFLSSEGSPTSSGLQIYSTSVTTSYSSATLPSNFADPAVRRLTELNNDIMLGASMTLGWTKTRAKSTYSFVYSPEYSSRLRHSDL